MHIAFLTTEYIRDGHPEGGLASYLKKVGRELSRRGHNVTIFWLSSRNANWRDDKVQVHETPWVKFNWRLYRVGKLSYFLPALSQFLSARRVEGVVWKVHRKYPIDILQSPNYKSPGYTLVGNSRFPVVSRISSYSPLWRSTDGLSAKLGDRLCDWLEINQLYRSQGAFAPSQFIADVISKFEGYQSEVIRTPVCPEDGPFDHSIYNEHFAGKSYLVYFGTLNRIKGIDLLAQVTGALLEEHRNLHLAFIGRDHGLFPHPKAFPYLQRLNAQVADRLYYHPPLPKNILYPIIANSKGVLMPSRADNYPNACLEALALGVPVVGTYGSSLDEMIVDGKTGFLAKNSDPDSLLQSIRRLLSLTEFQSRTMRSEIAAEVQHLCADDCIGRLTSFYEKSMNEFRPS